MLKKASLLILFLAWPGTDSQGSESTPHEETLSSLPASYTPKSQRTTQHPWPAEATCLLQSEDDRDFPLCAGSDEVIGQ